MLLSIIVPVYNERLNIRRCIESLFKATVDDSEIILVDDGSTDGSEIICDECARLDPRIKVVHIVNGGVSHARNVGLKLAQGDYTTFVDSDDSVEPFAFQTLLEIIKQNNAQLLSYEFVNEFVDDNGAVYCKGTRCTSTEEKDFSLLRFSGKEILASLIDFPEIGGYACNKLFDRRYIVSLFDETLAQCEDFLFVAFFASGIERSIHVKKRLYHYRRRIGTNFVLSKRAKTLSYSYEALLQLYRKHCPERAFSIELDLLKIYLNHRAKIIISNDSDIEYHVFINDGIKRLWQSVTTHPRLKSSTKINLLLTRFFPKTVLRIKEKIKIARQKKH